MPTPEKHALLSASSSGRWLRCTASPRFEENFPESTSEFAEEGRLAHSFCELKVLKKFTTSVTQRTYTTRLNKLKQDERYQPEMEKTSDIFIEHLTELAMTYDAPPYVAAEVRVDFSEFVPEGFGTCDCVMIGGDTITIVDYKHGKGVPVDAEGNTQMMLYALGALKKYAAIYGDTIKNVRMCIDQPRIQNELSMWETTVDELKIWGTSIRPLAEKAFNGGGVFLPGEHCRFCRGKAQCKARADVNTALYEFIDCIPEAEGPLNSNTLTNEEIGELLIKGADLVSWYKDLEEYALKAVLNGDDIPGWKAVSGRSNRTFSDQDAAIKAAIDAGYDEALLYERKAKTLTEIEKLMGKAEFAAKIGQYVIKPAGKPTLATISDKRPQYNPAAADFAGVANDERTEQ
jgi:hypothetical protein